MPSEQDSSYRAQNYQGMPPAGKTGDQAHLLVICALRDRPPPHVRFFRTAAGKLRQREQWNQRQHRYDGDVLKQQHGEARAAPLGLGQTLLVQRLQNDGGGGQRENQPDRDRNAPVHTEQEGAGGDEHRGDRDLQAAESEQAGTHLPQHPGLQLQPDQKQHHHDAEFREVLNLPRLGAHQPDDGPDQNAGDEIAEHRSQSQALGDGHGNNRGAEVDKGLKQESAHGSALLNDGIEVAVQGRQRTCGLNVQPVVAQGFEHSDPIGDVPIDSPLLDRRARAEQGEGSQVCHAAK